MTGPGFAGFLPEGLLNTVSNLKITICPTIKKWSCLMRTSSDPKNEKIKLRLNEDMKNHVDKSAKEEGISISEYIRELIRQDMKNKK